MIKYQKGKIGEVRTGAGQCRDLIIIPQQPQPLPSALSFPEGGYDVAFTLGNSPRIDLLATVPDGKPFKIQVKDISKEWGFFVQESFFRAEPQKDLFLIIVVVARELVEDDCVAFRFFILSHADAIEEGGKMAIPFERGLNWGPIKKYEDAWHKLPKTPPHPEKSHDLASVF